jgi:hypothetical protein
MALGSLVAAGVLSMLKLESDRAVAAREDRVISPTHVPAPKGAS